VATTRTTLKRNTEVLFKELGENSSEVARSLADAHISGQPESPTGCPVARFLNAVVGGDTGVSSVAVWRREVHIRPSRRFSRPVVVVMPRALRDFVLQFDSLRFPQLVEAESGRRKHAVVASTPS
jgi:hypothetical protein